MNSYSCLFSASYQQIYNSLYKALVSEYFLVIFALSFSHSLSGEAWLCGKVYIHNSIHAAKYEQIL